MHIGEAVYEWVNQIDLCQKGLILDSMELKPESWEILDDIDGNPCEMPMWNTIFSFREDADDRWGNTEAGIRALKECGFTVLMNDEYGLFFGIDGAGYNFYTQHWLPLYKKRGIQWHDEEEENAE